MEMTIREAVEFYTKAKCAVLKKSYNQIINETSLCIIIELNNGIRLFFDMHPEMDYVKENPEFSYEIPNKNNVFKRFTFDVEFDKSTGIRPVVPANLVEKFIFNSVWYYPINPLKEREVNELIIANGGINIEEYKQHVLSMLGEDNK